MSGQHSGAQRESAGLARAENSTIVIFFVSLFLMALILAILVRAFQFSPGADEHSSPAASRQERPTTSATIVSHSPEPMIAQEPWPGPIAPVPEVATRSEKDATTTAASLSPSSATPPSNGGTPAGAPPPAGSLVERFDRETYDSLAQLRAALDSQAWPDAARVITSASAPMMGFAPSPADRELLVSFPTAVQLALAEHPRLRQTLETDFASLATLRVAQAVAGGEPAAVELASIQFAPTPAAAEAHRWLADRALADGFFQSALAHYRKAAAIASNIQVAVAPRAALASAMLGREAEALPPGPVQFGDKSLSADEFESLLDEMRRHAVATAPSHESVARVPAPARFTSHVRSRPGEPSAEPGNRISQNEVPQTDQPLAVTVQRNLMYVSDGSGVAAYDLDRAEQLWQRRPSASTTEDRRQQRVARPTRPLALGDRVCARVLDGATPQLVCVGQQSGELIWTAEQREGQTPLTDPLVVRGKLALLTIQQQPDEHCLLRFCTIDPRTGEMMSQHELVSLHERWSSRAGCEVIEHDDGLIAALGGLTLSVNADGLIRWLRKHPTSPDDHRRASQRLPSQSLLSHDKRLFVTQPDARAIECLDAATGHKNWSAAVPELVGIAGRAGEMLIVHTETEIRGLHAGDGQARWRFSVDHLVALPLADDQRLLLASQEPASGPSKLQQLRLTWLNPLDGQRIATTVVSDVAASNLEPGPLVAYNDRLFTFFGRGRDNSRDLIELIPAGELEAVSVKRRPAWSR